jgi:hypothetical protein
MVGALLEPLWVEIGDMGCFNWRLLALNLLELAVFFSNTKMASIVMHMLM